VFLQPGADRIGRKYLKARFVEFTDDAFTRRKVRAAQLLLSKAPANDGNPAGHILLSVRGTSS
jgi:hypothetical protein